MVAEEFRWTTCDAEVLYTNRYMGAVNNTTSISNDVYRGRKYNYIFRPDPAIIRLHPKGIRDSVTTMRLYKDGEISSSGYSYVIIKIKIKN